MLEVKTKSLSRSLLKGTVVNLGLQLANRNLSKNNFWQTLLVGAAGGFGDYFGGNTAMGAIIGGGNALINKTKDFGTAVKYAAIGGAADLLLKVKEAKALKPYQDEPIPITDEFLAKAQKVWFKDFPMEYVKMFTVENVTPRILNVMEYHNAHGVTQETTIKNTNTEKKYFSGKSLVSFKADAFSSARYLFYVMGHELMHVYQNILLKGEPYPDNQVDYQVLTNLKEFYAYNFQKEILGDDSKKLPPCTAEEIRESLIKYPLYNERFQYFSFDWIKTINFIYPF